MAHTPLNMQAGDSTPEAKFATLPQLKRNPLGGAGCAYISGGGPTPSNDGTPVDPDIATALASPQQWVLVTNWDGSIHHVVPVSEMKRPT